MSLLFNETCLNERLMPNYTCVCVFVDGWPRSGSYLWYLWSGAGVSRRPFFWRENHTKSCACENLRDRKRGRRTLVSPKQRVSQLGVRPRSGQSGAEKLSVRSGWSDISEVRSETPEHGVKTEQWRRCPDVSAFLVAVSDFCRVLVMAMKINKY